MKPSKAAVIYARDENGKVLAKARVSNLSHEHVEGVKRALLEQVGTMVLRRKCEPKEVDIDDSAVVEKRKKEAKEASSVDTDDPLFAYEKIFRSAAHARDNSRRSDLTRQFELRRRSVPAVAPVAAASAEAPAAKRAVPGGIVRKIFRMFGRGK